MHYHNWYNLGMNYMALLAPLAYIAAVQLGVKYGAKPSICASVAVLMPFIVSSVAKWIYFAGYDLPVAPNVFSLPILITVVCQFALAAYVFQKLSAADGYVAWIWWAVGGGIVVIYVVPAIIAALIR